MTPWERQSLAEIDRMLSADAVLARIATLFPLPVGAVRPKPSRMRRPVGG